MSSLGIKIFLPDGDPNGVKVITLEGWTGKTFVIPRGRLKDMNEREEAEWPAVYFLLNSSREEEREVYIGESDSFLQRLQNHDVNKDFWEEVVVFTGDLNRATVMYLENKSIAEAKKLNRFILKNQNNPGENTLSEYDRAAADNYFETMKLTLSLLGVSIFESVPSIEGAKKIYLFKTNKADARGVLLDSGEFLVYKGSTARIRETASLRRYTGGATNLRRKLLEKDVLVKKDETSYEFSQDYIFTSPSAAGDTVAGRSTNGWTAWKDEDGKTLDENVRK